MREEEPKLYTEIHEEIERKRYPLEDINSFSAYDLLELSFSTWKKYSFKMLW